MYNVYSNVNQTGVAVETAEQAWRALRDMPVQDSPRIDLMLNVGGNVVSFCVATWYSVIYTGLDTLFNLTDEEFENGITAIDNLVNTYDTVDSKSKLTVFGCHDLVVRNRTEQIDYEYLR